MNIPDDFDTPAEINIVPMIDVIFAILAFFIMASLFLTRSEGLPVNLPEAATAEAQRRSKIVVTVDAEGQVSVNQTQVEVTAVGEEVRREMDATDSTLVVINADESVNHGQVVAVMDELRTVEGARIGIATKPQTP
jgi:biopolymer transport protein ExbD